MHWRAKAKAERERREEAVKLWREMQKQEKLDKWDLDRARERAAEAHKAKLRDTMVNCIEKLDPDLSRAVEAIVAYLEAS